MNQPSTKPYLIRAIYEWCCECGFTPLLSVKVDAEMKEANLPEENIKDGEIIFNIKHNAVRNLNISNDIITFSARFNGVAREITLSTEAVNGIFAREINQGISFPDMVAQKNNKIHKHADDSGSTVVNSGKVETKKKSKTNLHLIK